MVTWRAADHHASNPTSMISPASLLTTNGTRADSRSPSTLGLAWSPTQAHFGPHPARPTPKTGCSPRRRRTDRAFSGSGRAVHGSVAWAAEARIKTAASAANPRVWGRGLDAFGSIGASVGPA